jgi:hypothetical protein
MAAKTFRLRIAREGQEFEAEGDKNFVMGMLERFAPQFGGGQSSRSSLTDEKGRGRKGRLEPTGGKPLSIREFVQQLGLKKHTDITLAFGYYLEKYLDVSEFTPADINSCYYEAKLEASNTSQMIIQNIRSGRLMASRKKGDKAKNRYTLTASGEGYIESKLPRRS